MRRHSIIAQVGLDKINQMVEAKSQVTKINFLEKGKYRLDFGLGQMLEQLASRGLCPDETAVDLMILGATVIAADTRISRKTEAQDSWTREIDLYVPVKNPALWLENSDLLCQMLKFLTGDRWRIFFRPRPVNGENLVRRNIDLIGASFSSVCLFSGGLDSFVGAIDRLEAKENPLFVSHYWDAGTSSQKLCAQHIGTVYGDMNSRHVRARIGFPNNLVRGSKAEMTMRSRSFLFFSLAALAASCLADRTPIYIPENGLISLNVPLDPLRLGAWSTRTTHPFYMAQWQELLNRLNIKARIENPYQFKTKGEMLSDCANQRFLKAHLSATISCSSFGKGRYKGLSPRHCGYCLPCLIRRAAINAAFGKDPTKYSIADLSARPLNSKRAEAEQIRSLQMIYRRLSKSPNLSRILVHKSGPLSGFSTNEIAKYASVFRRGIEEVSTIVNGVTTRPL